LTRPMLQHARAGMHRRPRQRRSRREGACAGTCARSQARSSRCMRRVTSARVRHRWRRVLARLPRGRPALGRGAALDGGLDSGSVRRATSARVLCGLVHRISRDARPVLSTDVSSRAARCCAVAHVRGSRTEARSRGVCVDRVWHRGLMPARCAERQRVARGVAMGQAVSAGGTVRRPRVRARRAVRDRFTARTRGRGR
jgi:hypothetical protein